MRAVGDDLDALRDQAVDDAADRLLVARDGARGKDHAVALARASRRDARPRRCARARRAARPGCRCTAPRPCRAAGSRRRRPSGNPGCRRDSRSRARPARRAPWRGRPPPPRGRTPRAASATARMRADIGGEGRDRDAARARSSISSASVLATRPRTASGLRAPRWWNRRSARGSPRRRARAACASSVGGAEIGVGSSFQSPVCSTLPSGVRMISAFDSGIECATETTRRRTARALKRLPSGTTLTGTSGAPRLAERAWPRAARR